MENGLTKKLESEKERILQEIPSFTVVFTQDLTEHGEVIEGSQEFREMYRIQELRSALEQMKDIVTFYLKEQMEKAETIWREYALADDSKLTKDAIKLKKELLRNPYKFIAEMINHPDGCKEEL